MSDTDQITIRSATKEDLERMTAFFVEAYGNHTVFQDKDFVSYYFDPFDTGKEALSFSVLGLTKENKVVSHYGGLYYELVMDGELVPLVWGVNAYTLPDWRGKGINGGIVDYIHKNNVANAVIGMPFKAPFFYEKLGYNIFEKQTLDRFIYVLDDKAFEVAEDLGYDIKEVTNLLALSEPVAIHADPNIIELTSDNFEDFQYDLVFDNTITTNRSVDFLRWRIFDNPYVTYSVYGYMENNHVKSYIVLREEMLLPKNYMTTRIIDLYGHPLGVEKLLAHTVEKCRNNETIYIDFGMYGVLYKSELEQVGFIKLVDDDVCILPLVTAPIQKRPNHEFIVLQSKTYNDKIKELKREYVYFTRIDADRDRIARLSQIKKNNG